MSTGSPRFLRPGGTHTFKGVRQTGGPIIVWSGTPGVCRGPSPKGGEHLLDVSEEATCPNDLQGAFPDGLVHAAVVSPGEFQVMGPATRQGVALGVRTDGVGPDLG